MPRMGEEVSFRLTQGVITSNIFLGTHIHLEMLQWKKLTAHHWLFTER